MRCSFRAAKESWKFWEEQGANGQAADALAAEQPKSAPGFSEAPPQPAAKPGSDKVQQQAVATQGGTPQTVRSLVGLDFTGVRDLLGEPALEEIVAPATVWAYSGRGCVLNIFLLPPR